ncbi:MAG: SdrD B-like domain-containing protein [Patescibacteria group bacterium]
MSKKARIARNAFLVAILVVALPFFSIQRFDVNFSHAQEAITESSSIDATGNTVLDSGTTSDTSANTSTTDTTTTESASVTDIAPSDSSTADASSTDSTSGTAVDTAATVPADSTNTSSTDNSAEQTVSSDTVQTDSSQIPVDTVQTETTQASTDVSSDASGTTDNAGGALTETIQGPVLTTDKEDYSPGETVGILGRFFSSLQNIVLKVFGGSREDETYTESTQNVTADGYGSFIATSNLEEVFIPLYTVITSAINGDELARTTFTDSHVPSTKLSQFANIDNNYQGGNLNPTNSSYVEGNSVPYRYFGGNATENSNLVINIKYQYKSGVQNAFDFLTSDDASEGVNSDAIRFGPDNSTKPSGFDLTACSNQQLVSIPDDPAITLDDSGTRQFRICASNAFTVDTPVFVGASGDDKIIKIVLHPGNNGVNPPNQVNQDFAIFFGGHLALDTDWAGDNNGAGDISGAPFHMRVEGFGDDNGNGTQGSGEHNLGGGDLSIQSGVVTPPASTGLISGQKFNDLNGNGLKDGGEPGLSGWTINLTGVVSSGTVADGSGNYTFSGLADGSYTVCEVLQSGWTQTYPSSGASCSGTTNGYSVTITGGNTSINNDFGNFNFGQISGKKYNDLDQNGEDDAGEPGLSGWTIYLDTNNNGALDGGEPTQTTASGGGYTFSNLGPGTYHVREVNQVGWTQTDPTAADSSVGGQADGSYAVDMTSNGNKTQRNFGNYQKAKLTVVKVVTNDNGGNKVVADFPLFINGNPVTSGASNEFVSGTYTVSETSDSGYTGTIAGDCASNGAITLAPGDDKTCTITNDDKPATLIVKKVVDNGNTGATTEPSTFSFQVNGGTATAFETDGQNDLTVNSGTYSVTEPGVSGYSTTYDNCSGLVIANGSSATCAITNTAIAPTLKLVKTVIKDNGGTATESDFQGKIDGNNVSWNSVQVVTVGAHTASEIANVSGYIAGDWGGDCAANGSVTLALGENKICTVANDDQPGTLHVVKVLPNDNGGNAAANQFSFSVNGGSATAFETDGQNDLTVDAGTYSVTETNPMDGYTLSYDNCTDVVIPNGGEAACTITNNDQPSHLIVKKHVISDNGGLLGAGNFTITVANDANPGSFSGSEAGTDVTVNAGSYSATEGDVYGYAMTGNDCSGTIANGETKTCTITNDDIAPKLTVIKNVVNNFGGPLGAADFTMHVDGTNPSASSFSGSESGTVVTLDAGSYSVTEDAVIGYEATIESGCSGTLSVGDEKTCTITNNDIQPQLIVTKHVVNDNGGNTNAGNFNLSVSGTGVSPSSFPGDENGTTVGLNAGSYGVSETSVDGYASSLSSGCSGAIVVGQTKTCTVTNDDIAPKLTVIKHVIKNNGGTAVAGDFTMEVVGTNVSDTSFAGDENGITVTLNKGSYSVDEDSFVGYAKSIGENCSGDINIGEEKTCTITNDDIAPKLTLNKVVVGDNGGTESESAWTITATGDQETPTVLSGNGAPGSDDVVSGSNFQTGIYSLSESGPFGYAASSWTCAGDVENNGDEITLGLNQTATCAITNDDIAPSLTLIKHAINDNGGTAAVTDWTLSATGLTPISGQSGVTSDGTFSAGTYNLSETGGPAGYNASGWICTAGVQNGSSITLGVGQTAICAIANDDIAPRLIVVKHVINDDWGFSSASNFTMIISGSVAPSGNITFSGSETGVTQTLPMVGSYIVSESGPQGYSETYSAGCTGSIGLGETKTCTITNDDFPGRMTGGGSVFTKTSAGDTVNGAALNNVRVTHGFQIQCKIPDVNDSIEINWNDKTGKSHKFHLETLTSAICTKNGNPAPPKNTANGFNTFTGVGIGRYDGISGATLNFVFTDNGEPGRNDTASYLVKNIGGSTVLQVSAKNLDKGNQQAHRF